jgi:hypothetical protein
MIIGAEGFESESPILLCRNWQASEKLIEGRERVSLVRDVL